MLREKLGRNGILAFKPLDLPDITQNLAYKDQIPGRIYIVPWPFRELPTAGECPLVATIRPRWQNSLLGAS